MRITESQLRKVIREAWIDFAKANNIDPEIHTMGDFRKFIKKVNSHKRAKKGEDVLKDIGSGFLADLIPGGGTIMSAVKGLRGMYKAPDDKKTDTDLDLLNVDDRVSRIVDDTIEDKFFKVVTDKFDSLPDNAPIPNMTKALSNFIAGEYDDRTVTGFDESIKRKKMRITESQLRRYIRRVLKENYQSYKLNQGVPQSELIPPEDMPIIQAVADRSAGKEVTLEVTPKDWQVTLFRRGNVIALLQHDIATDVWTGIGPSEREADALGERKLKGAQEAMKFAQNFGGEGPIDRGLSAIGDFFSF